MTFVIKIAITSPPQEELSEESIIDKGKRKNLSHKMETLTLTEELSTSSKQKLLLQQRKAEERSDQIVEEPMMTNIRSTIEVPILIEKISMAKQKDDIAHISGNISNHNSKVFMARR